MSVLSELERISSGVTDIANALEQQGVTVPEGTRVDDMAALVLSIPKISVDAELKTEGMAADAKATGDAIKSLEDALWNAENNWENAFDDLSYEVVRAVETAERMDYILSLANTYYAGFFYMYIGETTADGRYVKGKVYKIEED